MVNAAGKCFNIMKKELVQEIIRSLVITHKYTVKILIVML